MKTVIVAGGTIDTGFSLDFCKKENFKYIIGVDAGTKFLYENSIRPDVIVGDFDSLSPEILFYYEESGIPVRRFQPQKDASDMEIAVKTALDAGSTQLYILGGTGTRLDHVLSNIQTLAIPEKLGVRSFLIDANNRIRLLMQPLTIKKEQQFGKYVSFFPLTTVVTGVCLEGFAYPLNNHTFTSEDSLGVSNEIKEEEVRIAFKEGILIMVESRD